MNDERCAGGTKPALKEVHQVARTAPDRLIAGWGGDWLIKPIDPAAGGTMTADALRHRTATSTDLQRGFCPTTQLIQPADTLPRGLPLTISSSRLTALVITDEASPFALRSIRNRLRRAVRRGAADRRRSDGTVACWWGSSLACWRWPHRRAVMVAERRMRCPPQEHGSASSRSSARRGGPDVRMPAVAWSPCPHPRSASTRPVSGVRSCGVRSCDVRVRCPMSGCPGVHCPGCPASVSAFRVPVRVRCVRTGAFVERVGQPHG